jgi:hypothetical protein
MTAALLARDGSGRLRQGLSLLLQAIVDLVRGIYLVLTGLGLLLAALALALLELVMAPVLYVLRAAGPWFSGLRMPDPDLRTLPWRWVGIAALSLLGAVVLPWLVGVIILAVADGVPDISGAAFPLLLFFGLGLLVLCLVGLVQLAGIVLAPGWRSLTRASRRGFGGPGLILLAAACVVLLYALIYQPPLSVALWAGFACAAGATLVSLGPSFFAFFGLGGRRGGRDLRAETAAPGAARAALRAPLTRVLAADGSRRDASTPAPADSVPDPLAGPAFLQIDPEPGPVVRQRLLRAKALVQRYWRALVVALILLMLALLVVEALLRPRVIAPGAEAPPTLENPSAQAAPPAPVRDVTPRVITLLADGAPHDVAWVSGYRSRAAKFPSDEPVSSLALPPEVCGEGILVVFGAASSDGDPDRNQKLSDNRAGWLSDLASDQLGNCPGAPPAILRVSLGQAVAAPQAAQRRIRLMAISAADAATLAPGSIEPELPRLARTAFGDLADFSRFDVCTYAREGDATTSHLPPACLPEERRPEESLRDRSAAGRRESHEQESGEQSNER